MTYPIKNTSGSQRLLQKKVAIVRMKFCQPLKSLTDLIQILYIFHELEIKIIMPEKYFKKCFAVFKY